MYSVTGYIVVVRLGIHEASDADLNNMLYVVNDLNAARTAAGVLNAQE
ncbi:hypothetical protein [Paenibacillus sp. MER TA 81-3]|nr:hypothetical protein [Paenibacillus sp. MER TA 81-3]